MQNAPSFAEASEGRPAFVSLRGTTARQGVQNTKRRTTASDEYGVLSTECRMERAREQQGLRVLILEVAPL
jgi:hypothetical protein